MIKKAVNTTKSQGDKGGVEEAQKAKMRTKDQVLWKVVGQNLINQNPKIVKSDGQLP